MNFFLYTQSLVLLAESIKSKLHETWTETPSCNLALQQHSFITIMQQSSFAAIMQEYTFTTMIIITRMTSSITLQWKQAMQRQRTFSNAVFFNFFVIKQILFSNKNQEKISRISLNLISERSKICWKCFYDHWIFFQCINSVFRKKTFPWNTVVKQIKWRFLGCNEYTELTKSANSPIRGSTLDRLLSTAVLARTRGKLPKKMKN